MSPDEKDWSSLYPDFFLQKNGTGVTTGQQAAAPAVEFADIGCGYGGLLGECCVMQCYAWRVLCYANPSGHGLIYQQIGIGHD